MLTLPEDMFALLAPFAPLFSCRVWRYVPALVIGAILAPGRRMVSTVLRTVVLAQTRRYQNYHRVLSRAVYTRGGCMARSAEVTLNVRCRSRQHPGQCAPLLLRAFVVVAPREMMHPRLTHAAPLVRAAVLPPHSPRLSLGLPSASPGRSGARIADEGVLVTLPPYARGPGVACQMSPSAPEGSGDSAEAGAQHAMPCRLELYARDVVRRY
jgi:hypothetical protein